MNYPMTDVEAREALIGEIYLPKKIYGYSAYELAVKHGFKGSEDEWLYSLNAYSIAVRNGFRGSEEDWLLSLSAYGLAVRNGFEGTLEEWISSIKGEKGEPGTMELHGDLDALGERIKNVANPVDDYDVVNKKYLEEQNSASKDYVDETFVKKDSQLNANSKTILNVADPENDTDAVNKKYVHDNFQLIQGEDISDTFISQVHTGYTVSSVKAIKQQNIISGEIEFRGELGTDALPNFIVTINSDYKPVVRVIAPMLVILDEGSTHYFNEPNNVFIDNSTGLVYAGAYTDNEGFDKRFVFSFTYLCG